MGVDRGIGVGAGEVGAGAGVTIGALVGIGMLDAATGPATGVLVGGTGVGVSVGALVGVGVRTGSCPQATVRIAAMAMMAKTGFTGEPCSNPIQCASIVAVTWEGCLTSSPCDLTFSL